MKHNALTGLLLAAGLITGGVTGGMIGRATAPALAPPLSAAQTPTPTTGRIGWINAVHSAGGQVWGSCTADQHGGIGYTELGCSLLANGRIVATSSDCPLAPLCQEWGRQPEPYTVETIRVPTRGAGTLWQAVAIGRAGSYNPRNVELPDPPTPYIEGATRP